MREIKFLLTLSIAVFMLGNPSHAQNDWEGIVTQNDTQWLVNIKNAETGWKLSVPSLWLGYQEIEKSENNGLILFDIPEMGRFQGKVKSGHLVGKVTFSDSSMATAKFEATKLYAFKEEKITYHSLDAKIGASIFSPEGIDKAPAVVILHGGGNSDRSNLGYRFYGEFFASHGIICLLYDKRGNGESTGNWKKVGFDPRAVDVQKAVEILKKHPQVNPTAIGLKGVSQGSWVAGLAAIKSKDVSFVINVSGPLVPVVEADTYALLSELKREKADSAFIADKLALWNLSVNVNRDLADDKAYEELQALAKKMNTKDAFKESPYTPSSRESWWRNWYHLVLDYNPQPTLKLLDIPMLWIFGEYDSQSDITKNLQILQTLQREEAKDYKVIVYPGTGHGIMGPIDSLDIKLGPLATPPAYFEENLKFIQYFN